MRTINVTAGEAEDLTAVIAATSDAPDIPADAAIELALTASTTVAPTGGWAAPSTVVREPREVRASLLVSSAGQAGSGLYLWAKVANDGRTYLLCCSNEYVDVV